MNFGLDEISAEGVRGRAAVDRLLPTDPDTALSTARAIRHPWYRCQALTEVAKVLSPLHDSIHILEESLAAAHAQHEPNRIVTVAAWPLSILIKLDRERTVREVESLLNLASTELHGLRRLDALDRLLASVAQDIELRRRIAERYLLTAHQCAGWRADRTTAFRAEQLAKIDLPLAKEILASRRVNRFSKKAVKAVEALEHCRALSVWANSEI
ncbi:MAG: hypothetical protein OEY28_10860 [Nitrospira sp.]|nr:hypothetical protein [Nitrospira sp.]